MLIMVPSMQPDKTSESENILWLSSEHTKENSVDKLFGLESTRTNNILG